MEVSSFPLSEASEGVVPPTLNLDLWRKESDMRVEVQCPGAGRRDFKKFT